MDVRLPDGTIISNVPDGTTKAQLREKLGRNGYDVSGLGDVEKPTMGSMLKAEALTSIPGGIARGLKDVVDTGAQALATVYDKARGPSLSSLVTGGEAQRIKGMNAAGNAEFSGAQELVGAGASNVARVGGQVIATAPVGGVLAKGAEAIPFIAKTAPGFIQALRTSGMTTGANPLTFGAKAADLAVRAGAGAVVGGVSAGAVNPEDAGTGALIGGALPVVIKGMGAAGGVAADAWRAMRGRGDQAAARALEQALEAAGPAQKQEIINALRNSSPILPGSNLTVAQALQQQGVRAPGAQMLERLVSQGPGGDKLLTRYADQGAARTGALAAQGAETYQGAVKDMAERSGSKIGAVLRTQAGDDKAAARAAWESVHGVAARDGVRLELPLQGMERALSPLGPGTVGAGADARALLKEAQAIGTESIPALPALPKSAGKPQTLEQAVRSAGGIKSGNALSGELGDLRIKGSGTTGLVMKNGKPADLLAEMMHARGFIPDADPATLFDALRNGGGRKVFSNDAPESAFQRMREMSMGDAPGAEVIQRAVPFEEFQRLRRSAGALGAKVGERAGGETEAGVLNKLQELLTQRADDAVSGGGDSMTPEFLRQYNAARDMTKRNAGLYKGGNNIASILRKPVGQDYTLGGDEIINKLWHGGSGLADDVSRLRQTLSGANEGPVMDNLQKFIMTEAAGKTTAGGELAAAFPKYVEGRLPGLEQAMTREQLDVLTKVAADIRNSTAAGNVSGLRGSDTYAKATRALDAGALDSQTAKTIAKLLSLKGVGFESLRAKMAENTVKSKGNALAELLNNPAKAAAALEGASPAMKNSVLGQILLQSAMRATPVVGAQ